MTAWQGDQPAAGVVQVGRELTRQLDRYDLVTFGMQEQHRDVEGLDRAGLVVLGEQRVERGNVGLELEPIVGQATSHPGRACRADRHDGGSPGDLGGGDRKVAAHARPAERDRQLRVAGALAQQLRHGGDVVEHAVVHRAGTGTVATLIEHDRGQAGAEHDACVVVMALLAGSRAVQDHDPGARRAPFREPQRVGEPVHGADLGRERLGGGSQSSH